MSEFTQKLQDITMQAKQREFASIVNAEIEHVKSAIESAMLTRAEGGHTYLDICVHSADIRIENKIEGVLYVVPFNTRVPAATLMTKLIEWFRNKHKLNAYMSEHVCRVSWDFKKSYLHDAYDWLRSYIYFPDPLADDLSDPPTLNQK